MALRLRYDGERDVFVRERRARVGLSAQYIRPWILERDVINPPIAGRERRRLPSGRPGRASPLVLPHFERDPRIELEASRSSVLEPRKSQTEGVRTDEVSADGTGCLLIARVCATLGRSRIGRHGHQLDAFAHPYGSRGGPLYRKQRLVQVIAR